MKGEGNESGSVNTHFVLLRRLGVNFSGKPFRGMGRMRLGRWNSGVLMRRRRKKWALLCANFFQFVGLFEYSFGDTHGRLSDHSYRWGALALLMCE
ncbi:hypothetical protein BDN70DRAFT_166352 [Pholiota conissans]|uniref:Uncharacterized protein n=1 Tax=Pholiota conissans TaxID=109636 RepID=A0A9P6CRS1_9AGAR|nr:hypothetical protein BDN70DRAFT_166352 [Pholiota conissans]